MSNKKTIWSGIVGIFSSILAFLGVVTCCGMPLVAGVLATFGIGASQLEFFAAYRWWFVAIAVVALIIGFYQSYFRRCDCGCGNGNAEDARKRKRAVTVQRIFLWIGVAAVAFAIFSGNPRSADSQPCCTENSQVEPSPCCGQSRTDTDNAPACCGSSTSNSGNAGDCCGAASEPAPSCNSCGN